MMTVRHEVMTVKKITAEVLAKTVAPIKQMIMFNVFNPVPYKKLYQTPLDNEGEILPSGPKLLIIPSTQPVK